MNAQEVRDSIIEIYTNLFDDVSNTVVETTEQSGEENLGDESSIHLNSLQYVKFIVNIEMKYDIEFEDDILYMNIFDTIDSFVDYAMKKINEK